MKLSTSMLQKSARLADQRLKAQKQLTEAFEDRYGATYSDADCDSLIDILDYHGGYVDLRMADDYMRSCGYVPLKKK